RSTEGGKKWNHIQEHPNAGNGFDDPVNITFDSTGGVIVLGDRGIYRSPDGSGNFANKQGNLQTNEMYTITLDPNNPNIIYGVSQDHGAALKGFGGPVWNYTKGGNETGKVVVSPTNSSGTFRSTPETEP